MAEWNHRSKRGGDDSQVLAQAQDRRSLSLVQLVGGYVPDYAAAAVQNLTQSAVRSVTGNMPDPNVTPPAYTVSIPLDHYGVVAFHVVFPAAGSGDLEVWASSGLDTAGNAVGWLLIDSIASIVSRKEYVRATGQRLLYLRLTNTANVTEEAPATVRACGVA